MRYIQCNRYELMLAITLAVIGKITNKRFSEFCKHLNFN